jgi:signal transduction protein with GAF and PtsI domain
MLHAAPRQYPAVQREPQPALRERLVQQTASRLGAPVMLLTLVENGRQRLLTSFGLTPRWAALRDIALDRSLCQYVVASVRPFYVGDAAAHWLIYDHPAVVELGVAAYAGVPLTTMRGQALGALEVCDARPRTWSAQELSLLKLAAAELAAELEQSDAMIVQGRRAEASLPAQATPPRDDEPSRALRTIAHDLGNALTVILGNAELALLNLSPETIDRAAIESIQCAARQARAAWDEMQTALDQQRRALDATSRSDLTPHAFMDITRDLAVNERSVGG